MGATIQHQHTSKCNIQANAAKSFSKKVPTKRNTQTHKSKPAKWYNNECAKAKNNLKRTAGCLKRDPFNRTCQDKVVAAKKAYKKTCKEAESNNRKILLDKLLNAEDPKEFWKRMKNMQGYGKETEDPSNCIPPKTWE